MNSNLRNPLLSQSAGRHSFTGHLSSKAIAQLEADSSRNRGRLQGSSNSQLDLGAVSAADIWTTSDELRLNKLEKLHSRVLEYHNNVHQKETEKIGSSSKEPFKTSTETSIGIYLQFSKSLSSTAPLPTHCHLEALLKLIDKRGDRDFNSNDFLWVNLHNLTELSAIAAKVDMHPLCRTGFKDLRAHSNIISTPEGVLISICYFQCAIGSIGVSMFKLFVYIADNIIVSFEVEIMIDTEDPNILHQQFEQKATSSVLDRIDVIYDDCCRAGSPMLLFYEIIKQVCCADDPLIDYISRSLFFIKNKVNNHLYHRQKMELIKKMIVIDKSLCMLDRVYLKNKTMLAQLLSPGSVQRLESIQLSASLATACEKFHPYIFDLVDTINFMRNCLETENEESLRLKDALNTMDTMRSSNATMLLSLVATAFLPMTFFTGVFGMNFQVNGGYTMDVVNKEYGPIIFYVLCIGVTVGSWIIFLTKGWIEPFPVFMFGSGYCVLPKFLNFHSNIISIGHNDGAPHTNKDIATREEEKRKEEASRKRHIQQMALTRPSEPAVLMGYKPSMSFNHLPFNGPSKLT